MVAGNIIKISIGSGNWQFIEKEETRECEVVNLKTKKQWKGFITSLKSNGTYIVKLTEVIEG